MEKIELKKENRELFAKGCRFTESFDILSRLRVKQNGLAYKGLTFGGKQAYTSDGRWLLVPYYYIPLNAYRDWWLAAFPNGRVDERDQNRNDPILVCQDGGAIVYLKEIALAFYENMETYNAKSIGYGTYRFEAADLAPEKATSIAFANAWKHGMANMGFGTDLDWAALDSSLDVYTAEILEDGIQHAVLYTGEVYLDGEKIRGSIKIDPNTPTVVAGEVVISDSSEEDEDFDASTVETTIPTEPAPAVSKKPAKTKSEPKKATSDASAHEGSEKPSGKKSDKKQVEFDLNEFISEANEEAAEKAMPEPDAKTEAINEIESAVAEEVHEAVNEATKPSEEIKDETSNTDESIYEPFDAEPVAEESSEETEVETEEQIDDPGEFELVVLDTANGNIKGMAGTKIKDLDPSFLTVMSKPSASIRKHLSEDTLAALDAYCAAKQKTANN